MQLLAIDFGYGYTKALTPGEKPFLVASTVGAEETIRFESDVISENGGGITVKVDGRWHFVGEQAELQSASGTQTLDATRTGSVEQLALFYATASELVKDQRGRGGDRDRPAGGRLRSAQQRRARRYA